MALQDKNFSITVYADTMAISEHSDNYLDNYFFKFVWLSIISCISCVISYVYVKPNMQIWWCL